jgi:asparagine synthase (glutamine-hydrolysing)
MHRRQWLRLIAEVKSYAAILGEPWKKAVWSWVKGPLLSGSGALWLRRHWRHLANPASAAPALAPQSTAWSRGLNETFAHDAARYVEPQPPQATTEREHHYRLLSRALLSQNLALLDAAAAPFSIELRFPFFDQRLVTFCLALPPEQKLRRGWTRLVLRHAMEGILPKKIQWRGGKSNLGPGFKYALLAFEQERLRQVLAEDFGQIGAFCDRAFLQKACERYVAQEASGGEALLLWRAVSLALWLQQLQHTGRSQSLSQAPKEVMLLSTP